MSQSLTKLARDLFAIHTHTHIVASYAVPSPDPPRTLKNHSSAHKFQLNVPAIAQALNTKPHNVTCRISSFRKKYGLNIACTSANAGSGSGSSAAPSPVKLAMAARNGPGSTRVTKAAAAAKGNGRGNGNGVGSGLRAGTPKVPAFKEAVDGDASKGDEDESREGEHEDEGDGEGEGEGGKRKKMKANGADVDADSNLDREEDTIVKSEKAEDMDW